MLSLFNARSSRPTRAAAMAARAGAFLENLEPRQLLSSSFVYTDLAGAIDPPEAALILKDYNGPIAPVGDIDGDGVTDLLVGRLLTAYTADPGGGPGETVMSGAAIVSGATSAVIRYHHHDIRYFGLGLAALGDVDADGTPDYAVSMAGLAGATAAENVAVVYSGKTGQLLHQFFGADVFYQGTMIAAAGDMNDDGHADFLFGSRGDTSVTLFSGKDGAVLRTIDGLTPSGLLGGVDFNDDGVSDIAVADNDAQNAIKIFSGADGSLLITAPIGGPDGPLDIRSGLDLDGDGTPDLIITSIVPPLSPTPQGTTSRAISGATGAILYTLDGPTPTSLAGPVAIIQDIDGDGISDLAATVYTSTRSGAVNLYSGRDGSLITALTDDGPASLLSFDPWGPGSRRMRLQGGVASADLNGDGFAELITAAMAFSERGGFTGISHTFDQGRILSFDGLTLGNAVFDGTSVDVRNNLVGWGRLGQAGFIYFRGQATYLKDLPGFSATDQIIKFTTHSGGYLIIAAPGGDQSRAFAWYGNFDLANPNVYKFSDYGPAAEDYTFQHIVDATNGQVMLQYAHASDATPAVFFFQLVVDRLGLVPRLSYAVDGVGIAVDSERYIYSPPDQPATTVIVDFAGPQTIQNFKPIDMRLTATSTGASRVLVLGLSQRDGDAFARPYLYDALAQTYTALPLIDGGTDWNPLQLNSTDSVVGTYKTATGKTAVFYTRSVFGNPVTTQTFDVTSGDVLGAPDGFEDAVPRLLGMRDVLYTGPNEIFITHQGPDGVVTARLAEIEQRGPFGSTPIASMVTSEDGSVIVTANLAGDLLVYIRSTRTWIDLGDWYNADDSKPVYDTPHVSDIVTWNAFSRPSIAISTDQGLILIESRRVITHGELPPVVEEQYVVRNLTEEVAGSEPITDSLLTFLPQDGRRVIGGLTANGDLVIYGMSTIRLLGSFDSTIWNWAYGNLTNDVLRAFGLPVPEFDTDTDGDLVGYVTGWNGQNIAGVTSDGDVVAFWTSPAIQGWQYTVISEGVQTLPDTQLSHLSVYLTPWNGINLVGGDKLNVYWWVPGQPSWQFDRLTESASGNGPQLRSETLTSYTAPWGGLNVAGLDDAGQLWVYWWAPTMTNWAAERITTSSDTPHIPTTLTGKLASAVSVAGFDIYARALSGDVMHYFWSVNNPWMVENTSVAI